MAEVRREWLEKDYYKDLELTKSATDEEINVAYKKLVRKLHPDRNPGNKRAEERFKEVSAAYDVIGNKETRQQYDQVKSARVFGAGPTSSGGQNFGGFSQQGQNIHIEGDLRDIFSDLLGGNMAGGNMRGGFGGTVPLRGHDYETNIRLTFDESMKGAVKQVIGYNKKKVKVKLPAGVTSGERVKVAGKGGAGSQGGPNGDLYVKVSVEKHEFFHRKGSNLVIDFPISFLEATLGGTVKVPTYDGDLVEIKIPAGTASGTKFKLKGRGVPHSNASNNGASRRGDLLVHVEVEVPKKLTSKQKNAVKEIGSLLGEANRDHLTSSSKGSGKKK